MIINIAEQIGAISREVSREHTESGETVAVTLQRRYDADQADVWQAITDPDRVRRWFLPLTGELREGGNFQLERNASGDIMTCEPPRHLMVTFGGQSSIVDVRLSDDGQQTLRRSPIRCRSSWPAVAPAPSTSDPAGTAPCSASRCILRESSPVTRSLPRTVPRHRTSMSVRSRHGSPRLKHRGPPTRTRFRQHSRSRWLSSLLISYAPSELLRFHVASGGSRQVSTGAMARRSRMLEPKPESLDVSPMPSARELGLQVQTIRIASRTLFAK